MTTEQVSELLAQFPKVGLALNPTPLHPMQRLQQDLGCGPLFIKRDDLNGLGVGGNKIRNLEYLLGDALAQGKKTILASGQTQSNLCSLCAAACCRLGLRCVLVHNSPPPKQLEGNALLNHLLGAKEYYMGEASEQERADFVEQLRVQLEQQGEEPYVIENGASSARGALGYVEAAVEIARQIQQDSSLSSIQSVCIPAGNGGLAAGMIYGTALLGNPFHIELISVEHPLEQLRAILLGFLQDAVYTGRNGHPARRIPLWRLGKGRTGAGAVHPSFCTAGGHLCGKGVHRQNAVRGLRFGKARIFPGRCLLSSFGRTGCAV